MDITELPSSELLKRTFDLRLTEESLEARVDAELERLATKTTLPGFRPGRVPLPVMRHRYGEPMRTRVIDRGLEELTAKALRKAAYPINHELEVIDISDGVEARLEVVWAPKLPFWYGTGGLRVSACWEAVLTGLPAVTASETRATADFCGQVLDRTRLPVVEQAPAADLPSYTVR
jgi:hypothetical protein